MSFKPATPRQKELVRKLLTPEEWDRLQQPLSFDDAARILGSDPNRWRSKKRSLPQKKALQEYGIEDSGLTRGQAWDLIAEARAALRNAS